MTESKRPSGRRADAETNRNRILEVARLALEENGEATMQSIAKSAGVGQGTMYRHFPNREVLVMEVHRKDVQALVDAAPNLIGDYAPLIALRKWFDLLADYGRIKLGLAGAIHSVTRNKLSDEGYGSVTGAITLLLEEGRDTGDIRDDVDAEDILMLVGFLWRIEGDDDWDSRSSHLLDLVMDCLRTVPSEK